ncbi:hypothetical protein H8S23_02280 [Anaerofilum sp. BX8]|uniref:Membrane protein 6-pyruvoyl-tetrahydropterin synthase-related domain-containing protein n=1 Tax=Anaerofilum hominis TaxID=2763016 RepID=A0A923I5T8_9FIRM|nr:hypothetical protein [Anaerofilum hominis]MBC5580324.1 hypothetical protein [Anaerofilum hominis]
MEKLKKEKSWYLLLAFALLVGCCWRLLRPGMFYGNDLPFHLWRIEFIKEGLKDGQFFLKIIPEALEGYGYPVNLFYSGFFLLIPAALAACGLSVITSYKLFLVLIICSAMFTCFYAVYKISQNRRTALLAVFLYIGSAYFETDLYSRAALGETQAFVFLPLVVVGFYEILWGDEKNISPLVIGFGGLLLSHLLTFFLAFLLGAFVCAIAVRRFFLEPKRFQNLFKAAVITVLLTAFFLFPLIEQMSAQLLRGKATHYGEYAQNRTMRLRNLFFMVSPPELYAPVAGVTFLGVLALRFFCGSPKTQAAKKRDLFYLMGIACLFACTSLFPWSFFEKLPGLDAIQFPWRFLLFATLFLAIGGAMAAEHFLEKISRPRWGTAVCDFDCRTLHSTVSNSVSR